MSLILLALLLPGACASLQARQCNIIYMDGEESHLKMRCNSVEKVEIEKMKA